MILTGKHFIKSTLICFLLLPKILATPDLKALKESNRLWLGSEQAIIVFKNNVELTPHSKGQLQILKAHQSAVNADEVWAVFNPDQLITERKSLELEQRKHDLLVEKSETPSSSDKLQAELFELKSNRYDLEQTLFLDDTSDKLKAQIEQGLEAIDLEITAHQTGEKQKETNLKADLELRASQISLAKQRKSYQTLIHDSEYKAPFAGQIEFTDKLLESHPHPEK